MKPDTAANDRSERSVLGACLLDEQAYWSVESMLETRHFLKPIHKQIWSAIRDVAEKSSRIDHRLVEAHLGEEIDGQRVPSYIAALLSEAVDSEAAGLVNDFADVLVDSYTRRAGIEMIEKAAKEIRDPNSRVTDVLGALDARISLLTAEATASEEVTIGHAAKRVLSRAEGAFKHQKAPGLGTGLSALDELLNRLMPEELIIIAGDPGSGKSSLAQQIAVHNAAGADMLAGKIPCLFFALDMSQDMMAERQIASDADMSSDKIGTGRMNQMEFEAAFEAAGRLADVPLTIVDMSEPRIGQIRRRCLAAKRRGQLGLVIIDHLLCVQPDDPRMRWLEAGDHIVRRVKGIAKECKCPVILLTHRTRTSQQRDNPRPRLSDMYGGGAADRSADVAFAVWHQHEHLKDSEPPKHRKEQYAEWEAKFYESEGKAELILLKARRGKASRAKPVRWRGERTRFEDL